MSVSVKINQGKTVYSLKIAAMCAAKGTYPRDMRINVRRGQVMDFYERFFSTK